MSDNQLTRLEQQIADHASDRYNHSFFRWGHLLGWLSIPLMVLAFNQRLKPFSIWISNAAVLLMFEWYVVVTTRVIGKLVATRSTISSLPDLVVVKPVRRVRSIRILSLLAFVGLIPVAALFELVTSNLAFGSRQWLIDAFGTDILIGGAIGFVALSIPLVIGGVQFLLGEEPTMYSRSMAFGASMELWAMILLVIWGVVTGVKFGQ